MRDDHTDLRKVIPALESGSYPAGAGHIRGIQVFGTDSEMMGNDVTGTYQRHTGFSVRKRWHLQNAVFIRISGKI